MNIACLKVCSLKSLSFSKDILTRDNQNPEPPWLISQRLATSTGNERLFVDYKRGLRLYSKLIAALPLASFTGALLSSRVTKNESLKMFLWSHKYRTVDRTLAAASGEE
jgi:hypothetical protein